MAEAPSFFSGLVGGVMGAVAAVDVPADGERVPRPAPGTDWGHCCAKLHESGRELEGFLQQVTFIVGKLAMGLRVGAEHLTRSLAEGRAPSVAILDKADVDQGLEAGKQGADFLLKGGKLVLEALLEGAKVAATRGLFAVEQAKDAVLRNIPQTQEKLSQVYHSFMRGYQGSGRSLGYSAPAAYTAPSYSAPSYGAPPAATSAQPSGGFFW